MKKLSILVIAIAVSAFVLSSCNKCRTCSYSYKFQGKDSTRTYPESCGNKKELDNYRQVVNADASSDNGATVTCTDAK